jgi:hypothetical protein
MQWDPIVAIEKAGGVPLALAGGHHKPKENSEPSEPDCFPDVPNRNRRLLDAWGRAKRVDEKTYLVLVDLYKVSKPVVDDAGRLLGLQNRAFHKHDLVEPEALTPELAADGIANGEIREVATKRLMLTGGFLWVGPGLRAVTKKGTGGKHFSQGLQQSPMMSLDPWEDYGLAVDLLYDTENERAYVDGELLQGKYTVKRHLLVPVPTSVDGGLFDRVPVWPKPGPHEDFEPRPVRIPVRLIEPLLGREPGAMAWLGENEAGRYRVQGKVVFLE